MPPAKRAMKRKVSGPRSVRGELRDLPILDTISESQAEREALFARAWRQKAARERGPSGSPFAFQNNSALQRRKVN